MLDTLSQTALSSANLLAYYRYICEQPFTVVDVETTGIGVDRSRVIEVSVLRASIRDGFQEQVTYLINPQVPIPPQIACLTGIYQSMVDGAPAAAEVWRECLPMLQQGILTAHNLPFDYAFLQAEYDRLGILFVLPPEQKFCTLALARLLLPELRSRSLPALVQHFNFDVGRSHRAEADTLACWMLAKQLLAEIRNMDDEALLDMFAQQWINATAAAALLGCSESEVSSLMKRSRASSSSRSRSGTSRYRRGDIESLL
ncbi:PolC-type DNA polymerase III [Pseudanabaena sp. PCC 6802]|uniref:3'-5' exonuclease n=1 Tax=Pseudanabaena sp. PCC 6802 TaxID=118173 RepID=UPI00034BB7E5|nr:3'-5' exonuclease [Pseudanabaena sp. PCC 6802]